MRDWSYRHEDTPSGTDEEFVAMVKIATAEGVMSSSWMPRLLLIAEKKTPVNLLSKIASAIQR